MKRARLVAWACAMVACQPKPAPRLFSDDELAAYQKDLAMRLAANAKQHCSPDLVAAIEGATLETKALETLVAAHPPGCSPYQIGVRAPPENPQRTLRAMELLEHRIIELASTDPMHAVTLGARTLQLYQDLGRGHVPRWLAPSASEVRSIVGATLDPIVAKLTPDQAAAFGEMLDPLIASVPPYAEALEGAREELESRPYRGDHFGDPRDEAGVMFALGAAWAIADAAECPPTAPLAICATQLARRAPVSPRLDSKQLALRLRRGEDRGALRSELLTQLPEHRARLLVADSARSIGTDVARLAALRIHTEIVRQGRCPTELELDAPPYSILRSPAALGDSLHLQRVEDRLDLSPPEWAERSTRSTRWSIRCPHG